MIQIKSGGEVPKNVTANFKRNTLLPNEKASFLQNRVLLHPCSLYENAFLNNFVLHIL